MRWAVLLAGGAGTRFWPLSTPTRPKQLLPLAGSTSSAAEAVARLEGLVPPERTLVMTSHAVAPAFRDALGLPPENVLAEPKSANTGPALAWATWVAQRRDPEAVILSTHADWHVPDTAGFVAAAEAAFDAAVGTDRLITVGIVPTRVEIGYGHIVPGESVPGVPGVRIVARFVEKPSAESAEGLMAEGALWNSGLFAWTAKRFLAEVAEHAPVMRAALDTLDAGTTAGVHSFFETVPAVAIDVGILEQSARVAVVRGTFLWDDIGTWEALFRVRPTDASGNVVQGPVTLGPETRGSLAWSDGPPIVIDGVEDLLVVAANGRILVLPRAHAARLKDLLERLPPSVREVSE